MNLDKRPADTQIKIVWRIRVSPMASGCVMRVKQIEEDISKKEDRMSVLMQKVVYAKY